MPPRTKKTTPAATDVETVNGSDLEAMRAEVAAEPETAANKTDISDKPFTVPFVDTEIRVKAILDWPVSSDKLLFASRFEEWAAKILDGDQLAEVWEPADPTLRQIIKFVGDLEARTGIPFGLQFTLPTS